MSGTVQSGKNAAITNKKKYGPDFYVRIGAMGGRKSKTGGFGSDRVGADGLTGKERARVAGARGGAISRRGPKLYDPAQIDELRKPSFVQSLLNNTFKRKV